MSTITDPVADTDLWIEVEQDFTTYGEEVKFGGGKVIRDGMGQSQLLAAEVVDTLITNALIIDHWGIVKADVGLKDGRIHSIGKAGNPDIQPNVTIAIGASTEVIAGEGMILTAGGIDTHIHFICPQQIEEALNSGVTTMIGGGTGPATGTNATTCTSGPWHMARMLQAADSFPMNMGFTGKGNASLPQPLIEQVEAGAIGLKLHEDWGTTPASIDNCLSVADLYDVQVAIHSDTLNESGFVETTLAAFKGRTIHTYHTEGAGGGHAPDIIKDRQYTTGADSKARRSCQTALFHISEALVRWIAPILAFTADELWQYLPGERNESVMLNTWYEGLSELPEGTELDRAYWERIMAVKVAVNKEMENLRAAKAIGGNLQAEVTLFADADLATDLSKLSNELRFVLITSTASVAPFAQAPADAVVTEVAGLKLKVVKSVHAKCARCWHCREDVGVNPEHPEICGRCVDNISGAGEVRHYA